MKKVIAVFVLSLALTIPALGQPDVSSPGFFEGLWSRLVSMITAVVQVPESSNEPPVKALGDEPEIAPSTVPNG